MRMTAVGQPAPEPTPRETRVEFVMLCDSAQTTQEGKLYVLGGGWSHIFRMVPPAGSPIAAPPTQFAVAISFLIDWNDGNRPINVRVTVEHQDERAPLYEAKAQLIAGRPPVATPGDPLRALIALPVLIAFPEAGSYCVRAQIEGIQQETVVRFRVADTPLLIAPPAPAS